jgi:hypothetical protein
MTIDTSKPKAIDYIAESIAASPSLTKQQRHFLTRIVGGETLYKIAKETGVSESVLRIWESQDWFIQGSKSRAGSSYSDGYCKGSPVEGRRN